ncbi:MAG: outer membrane protein assembly factor BamC [Sulfuriferula sp.]|nr:outer membrane protein assembly factor BamC [Sulfuriferula sp.]
MKRTPLSVTLICAGVIASLGGCSSLSMLETKKVDYKSAAKIPTLEVPPDLTTPTTDSHYQVPDLAPNSSTTYSAYNAEHSDKATAAGSDVLPTQDKVRLERAGSERWLVVDQSPDKVWPILKEFWQENGFILNVDQPTTGIMETEWAENRAKIPQDMIRKTLGKLLDGLYSTGERDKFRTRIERNNKNPNETEIYITHRGMIEVYDGSDSKHTVWQPRPADPSLEAEMLSRLMVRLGVEKARAEAMLAEKSSSDRVKLNTTGNGNMTLTDNEPFDRAWRRVGLALDRISFTVVDRDRAKGIYFVRYVDPEQDNQSGKDTGFFSKLAFWKSSNKDNTEQYQVELSENASATGTDIRVLSAKGEAAQPETANKIIKLLSEQLK